ncbi:MAG: hypothetical protein RR614_15385, partial [Eubacterium sp.]
MIPYKKEITARYEQLVIKRDELAGYGGRLTDAVNNHLYYGVHKIGKEWAFREWAPNARAIYVIGDFNGWQKLPDYQMHNTGDGNWELKLPLSQVKHGDFFKWYIQWNAVNGVSEGEGERIPAYAIRCVQDETTKQFSA